MEKIIIKKSGLYFSFWDEDTLSWTDRLISDSDLPITWYFQYSIEIEEFLTISDLLLLFAQYHIALMRHRLPLSAEFLYSL